MAIVVRLDLMMARRKVRSNVLARAIGITEANLSLLKSGKVKGSASRPWRRSARSWTASPATCWNSCPTKAPRRFAW